MTERVLSTRHLNRALWSRLRDFPRDALTKALEERRIVQATLMRVTIHMVSVADYPLFAEGIRKGRRKWWIGVQRHQVEGLDMKAAAARVRHHLTNGPRRQAELLGLLESEGFPRIAWSGAGLWFSIWSASHHQAPGTAGPPTSTAWPTSGWHPQAQPRQRV